MGDEPRLEYCSVSKQNQTERSTTDMYTLKQQTISFNKAPQQHVGGTEPLVLATSPALS